MLQVGEADDFVWDVEEANAAGEADVDIGLDLFALDTTMVAVEEKPVYPKVMTYNGYPMSKFYFNFLNINLFNCFFVTSSVGLKEVSHSLNNGWFAHYRCLQYRVSCFVR